MIFLLLAFIHWLIGVYLTILVIRMVIDWVLVLARNWHPNGFIMGFIRLIYQVTEPPLRWLRRWIPSIPLGPIQLDVSFLVLYFALGLIQAFI